MALRLFAPHGFAAEILNRPVLPVEARRPCSPPHSRHLCLQFKRNHGPKLPFNALELPCILRKGTSGPWKRLNFAFDPVTAAWDTFCFRGIYEPTKNQSRCTPRRSYRRHGWRPDFSGLAGPASWTRPIPVWCHSSEIGGGALSPRRRLLQFRSRTSFRAAV